MLKYFPRIIRGRRKNEDHAERNILCWKGLVEKKLLSAETTLNSDFNPKSVIISKNTNTKKKIFLDSY